VQEAKGNGQTNVESPGEEEARKSGASISEGRQVSGGDFVVSLRGRDQRKCHKDGRACIVLRLKPELASMPFHQFTTNVQA